MSKKIWKLKRGINTPPDLSPVLRVAIWDALGTKQYEPGNVLWVDFYEEGFMIGLENDPDPLTRYPVFREYPNITSEGISKIVNRIVRSMRDEFSEEDLTELHKIAVEGLQNELKRKQHDN